MKKYMKVVIAVTVVCLVSGGVAYGIFEKTKRHVVPREALDGKTMIITEDGFTPDSLRVAVGTTIKFINNDTYWHWPASDPHPSHTFYSELDPRAPIKPGTTWEVTLTKSGSWGIHDHLAPYITGTITVTP